MQYCKRCFYPDTKPDLTFNSEGICSACTAFDARKNVDWGKRENDFIELVDYYKRLKCTYDCVIPVSGGKDSTYQVITALKYGLKPICVTATTDSLSPIGRANLDNISKLGVDCIEISVDSKLRRKINKYTLKEIGDISWAEHITIFTIPVKIAIQLNVPLIIWGENPQNEYGGPEKAQWSTQLDQRWLEEFGGLNGLRVSDVFARHDLFSLKPENMSRAAYWYTYPNLDQKTTNGIFLGQFFPWDGAQNAITASQFGFKSWYGPVEGSGYPYENLDNYQTGIHDYFKYIKFGFGRATDIVSNHIRRGNISRTEGRQIILREDGKIPATYLYRPLDKILDEIDVTVDEFMGIVNEFANPFLFKIERGKWPKALFKQRLKDA